MKIKTIITCVLCSLALIASAQIENLPRKTLNGKEYYVYKVSKGESVYSISKKFNLSQSDIIKYNPSAKNGLKRDQMLFLPTDSESGNNMSESNSFVHTVRRGESLYAIAKMYHVTIDDIKELNPNVTSKIDVGDKLNIPQKGAKKVSKAENDAPAKQSATNKENVTTDYIYHTIASGETLYAISGKYDVTVKTIIRANPGIKPNKLQRGAVIRVPVEKAVVEVAQPAAEAVEVAAMEVVETPQEEIPAAVPCSTYIAKRKETFYSIAQKFEISIDSLKEVNRDIRVVKEGMTINIPIAQVDTNVVEENGNTEENTSEYLDNVYAQVYEKNDANHINVAVILPFMLHEDESNIKSSLYTEYYQGFLLAVDSLKRQGYSINLYAYDSQGSTETVKGILDNELMTTMHLIVAPEDDEAINLIADFGERYDINVVNTFSLKNERVNTNARVFQTNIPGSYLYAEATALFIKTFNNKSIIFLRNKDVEEPENEFVATLKDELSERNIPYTTCDYSTVLNASDLRAASEQLSVVFVPTSNKKEALVTILPGIEEFVDKTPNCDVSLFGYPGWVPQIAKNVNTLYKVDTYIFSRFYTIPDDPMLYDLSIKYLYWYNEEMKNASPRYAILGFDTGLYFMNAIAKYGKNFANYELPDGNNSIQTAFKFERINNWSGFINKSFYFVHLSPDMKIEKITQ